MARPAEDGSLRPAADVVPRQYQFDARRLRIHVAPLRPPFGDRQSVAFQSARIQQALRAGSTAARKPPTRTLVSPHVRARQCVRSMDVQRVPLREHPGATLGAGLQAHGVRAASVALLRHRPGAAQRRSKIDARTMTSPLPWRARRGAMVAAIAAATIAAIFPATPAVAADMSKTLRTAYIAAETGFDPVATSDLYSDSVQRAIFDTLYAFDYLARPYRRTMRTAAAMPEVTDEGRTWTMRVKPGIYFADDPVFKGKKRELVAADYVYAWKRLLDPRVRSPFAWYLQGKIVGADRVLEAAKQTGRFDYDTPIEGLAALDRYTLRLKLKDPDYIWAGYMPQSPMAAVAREVIEAYADASGWAMAHPLGTGPYMLKSWRRGAQLVLEANPNFRDETFPESNDAADKALVAKMRGKKLPIVGRIEISITEESNPRLLGFNSGALDYVNVPSDLGDHVLDFSGRLKPEYVDRGVVLARITQPALQYAYFNMEDPVLGGDTQDRIALRRSRAIGFNTPALIRLVYHGQAIPATQPIPPNLPGHDDSWNVGVKYDPQAANALLDKFGYAERDRKSV